MSEPGDGRGEGRGEDEGVDVGSVAEEAAKLFGALSEWARDHGADTGLGVSGLAAHAARSIRDVNEHIDTGSAECTYCPLCRTVHVVRQTSPEVRTHLASAASSLLQAAAGLLATAIPDERRAAPRGESFEHIDLDDETWPEEDE